MPLLPVSARSWRATVLAAAWFILVGGVLGASSARAQQQERGFLERLDHPDRTLHYGGADKAFGASSSFAGKQATVHSFTFKGGGVYGAGDGTFRTRGYNGADRFRTQSYDTKPAGVAGREFNQKDKAFGTKTMDVKEDRAANQSGDNPGLCACLQAFPRPRSTPGNHRRPPQPEEPDHRPGARDPEQEQIASVSAPASRLLRFRPQCLRPPRRSGLSRQNKLSRSFPKAPPRSSAKRNCSRSCGCRGRCGSSWAWTRPPRTFTSVTPSSSTSCGSSRTSGTRRSSSSATSRR